MTAEDLREDESGQRVQDTLQRHMYFKALTARISLQES
jgi:hypothetical protein